MAVLVGFTGACGSEDDGQPVAADSQTTTVSHDELEITHAIAVLFEPGFSADEKLAQLDADDLRDPVEEGMADPRAKVLTVKVTKVVVRKANATAFIDFYLNGQLALGDATLALVRKDSRWLVERESYCGLIQSTGPRCPPTDPNDINREPTGSTAEELAIAYRLAAFARHPSAESMDALNLAGVACDYAVIIDPANIDSMAEWFGVELYIHDSQLVAASLHLSDGEPTH